MKPKQPFLTGIDIGLIVGIVVFSLLGVLYAAFSGVVNVPGVTPVLQADVEPSPVAKKAAVASPETSGSGAVAITPAATAVASASPSPDALTSPAPETAMNANDARRKDDVANLQAILQEYFIKYKKYPLTNSGTNYEKIDTALKILVDTGYTTALPVDPVAGRFYMYLSDGKTYSLTAWLENTSDPAGANNSETPPKYLYTVKNP